jgi:CRISPR type I-E-associated protein CasB/Cse2
MNKHGEIYKGKEELDKNISALMKFLYSVREDRGVLADLRRGFSEDTQQRAWPHIAKFCDLRKERERKIVQLVSAGFAIHKDFAKTGNMGDVMRKIAMGDGNVIDGLSSYESRFRRLLSAPNAEELCEFLPGIIKTAEAKGVGINFFQLYKDLWYWSERTKVDWAAAYWGTKEKGGDADAVSD